jgi:hypothetical protein
MDLTGSVGNGPPVRLRASQEPRLRPRRCRRPSANFTIRSGGDLRSAPGSRVTRAADGVARNGSEREPDPRNVREGRIAPEREALRERSSVGAWYGEVSLRAEDLSVVGFDPGVLGCGVVLRNVGQDALAACSRLGEGLPTPARGCPTGPMAHSSSRRAISRDHERYSPECVEGRKGARAAWRHYWHEDRDPALRWVPDQQGYR